MKRVLIISYYWPPSGGSGVQRWLKMSKYLPENGWQPVIYTAENAEYPVEDPSLEKDVCPEAEVIRRPIVEPYNFYKRFLGLKKEHKVKAGFIDETGEQRGWKERLSVWIRGNFFIPDARCWWVKPSVRYLKSYLKEHPVDALISTGPPHSMHLIALKLKEALGIPWIADFRDPWTEIDYYGELRLTKRSDRKHHRLEHEVLTKADQVVTVSKDGAARLDLLGASGTVAIFNGFDQDGSQEPTSTPQQTFTLTYLGVLSKAQNPENLWEALGELVKEDETFSRRLRIHMIGQIDRSATASIQQNGLDGHVVFTPYIPHSQVFEAHRNSTLLLLFLLPDTEIRAKGLLTGKLFEYLASGRPILCIGPEDGDAAQILNETHAGITVCFENKEKMKETVRDYYRRYLENNLPDNDTALFGKYSRRSLTREYAELLNNLNPHGIQ